MTTNLVRKHIALGLKRMQLKRPRLGSHELALFSLVIAATLLRFILIRFNWPKTNSDEGTLDLMVLHIAYRGEHPIFLYGQNYYGPLQAYLGAKLLPLFGVSVFTVRLTRLLLFVVFLICMYFLTRLLYTKNLALATIGLLSLGSRDIIYQQLFARPEIVPLGALIFLLAVWLARSSQGGAQGGVGQRVRHVLLYTFLGVVIGLALWVDQVILPIVAIAGLLLLLFCGRELLWGGLCLVIGCLIGGFPLILYNLSAPAGQNSLDILLWLSKTSGADQLAAQHISLLQQWLGPLVISLPVASGANFCYSTQDVPFPGATGGSFSCLVLQGAWAAGFTLLWITAAVLACRALWHAWRSLSVGQVPSEKRQRLVRQSARLLLLLSGALTFVLFARSPSAALVPLSSSRYLCFLLLVTPALLWPLWKGLQHFERLRASRAKVLLLGRVGILLLVGTTFLAGTIHILGEIPDAQADSRSQDALIEGLLQMGTTRIYSEYWTCDRLIFASQERILCAVLSEDLGPGYDRYLPYREMVEAAPHPVYVLPLDSPQIAALDKCLQSPQVAVLAKALQDEWYRYVFGGYVVYENAPPPWLCSPDFDSQLLQRTILQAEPNADVLPVGSPEAAALAKCLQSPQRAALAKALQYDTASRSYVVAGYVVYEQAPPSWLCSLPDGVVRSLVERLSVGASLHSKGPNRPSGGTASP